MHWSKLDVIATSFAVLTVMLLASTADAQGRPDFSGRWSSAPPPPAPSARDVAASPASASSPAADLGSGWGRTITITQTEQTVAIEWPIFSAYDLQPPLRFVYALDGSETVNAFMLGRGIQRQRARARWAGDSLVLTTTHSLTDPVTGRDVPIEIQQTLVLEMPASLVVQTSRTPVAGASPATTRTVYTKGGGA